MAYIPPLSRIGKNAFIGPNAVLTNDPYPMCDKMMGVNIEDGAIIGAGSVIKAGVTVGKNSKAAREVAESPIVGKTVEDHQQSVPSYVTPYPSGPDRRLKLLALASTSISKEAGSPISNKGSPA